MILKHSVAALAIALVTASLMLLAVPVPQTNAAVFTGEACSHSGVISKSLDIAHCDEPYGGEWFASSGNLAQTAHAEWDSGAHGVSANVEWACDVGLTRVVTFASANARGASIDVWWRDGGFFSSTHHIADIVVTTDENNTTSNPVFSTPSVPVACSEPIFGWFPRFEAP
jgi:hypothetical protein